MHRDTATLALGLLAIPARLCRSQSQDFGEARLIRFAFIQVREPELNRFGRIVNVTSMSVKMPLPRLDLSSGARAGLTVFMAGVARTVAEHNVTINNLLYDSVL